MVEILSVSLEGGLVVEEVVGEPGSLSFAAAGTSTLSPARLVVGRSR